MRYPWNDPLNLLRCYIEVAENDWSLTSNLYDGAGVTFGFLLKGTKRYFEFEAAWRELLKDSSSPDFYDAYDKLVDKFQNTAKYLEDTSQRVRHRFHYKDDAQLNPVLAAAQFVTHSMTSTITDAQYPDNLWQRAKINYDPGMRIFTKWRFIDATKGRGQLGSELFDAFAAIYATEDIEQAYALIDQAVEFKIL